MGPGTETKVEKGFEMQLKKLIAALVAVAVASLLFPDRTLTRWATLLFAWFLIEMAASRSEDAAHRR